MAAIKVRSKDETISKMHQASDILELADKQFTDFEAKYETNLPYIGRAAVAYKPTLEAFHKDLSEIRSVFAQFQIDLKKSLQELEDLNNTKIKA